MLVGHQPIVAVGPGTYLDELMRIARADNIAAAVGQQWPHLSIEFIIAMRPQVILDGSMGTDPHVADDFWKKYPTIPAVRDHRVLGYAEDPMLHPGPRVGQSLEIIARKIHPEAWPREDRRCRRVNAPATKPAPGRTPDARASASRFSARSRSADRLRDRGSAVRHRAHQSGDAHFPIRRVPITRFSSAPDCRAC